MKTKRQKQVKRGTSTAKPLRAARGSEDGAIHVVSLLLKFQRVVADMKAMTTSMERLATEISRIQENGTCGSKNPPNDQAETPPTRDVRKSETL